ncbi:MAG: putative viral replication protein [Cressdnaviricota sp.]|nr:MAG: putative viral replication protein [Cressdnaviricota sp.]
MPAAWTPDTRPLGEKDPDKLFKDWVWTYHFPEGTSFAEATAETLDFECQLVEEGGNLVYCRWQLEKCGTTDRYHYQGFIQFKSRVKFTAVKTALQKAGAERPNTVHVEWRRGTVKQADDYCKKQDTQQQESQTAGTLALPAGQGARSDLKRLRAKTKRARSMDDLYLDEDTEDDIQMELAKYPKYCAGLLAAIQRKKARKFRKVKVITLWGTTGTGKTRYAYERGAFKWSPPSDTTKEWWDGYAGEKAILIDEFYGQMKPARLQELLDGYMCRMDIKTSHTYAFYDTVYITSNVSPEEWWGENVPAEVKASLIRRLTQYGGEIKHITQPMHFSDDEDDEESDDEPFIL